MYAQNYDFSFDSFIDDIKNDETIIMENIRSHCFNVIDKVNKIPNSRLTRDQQYLLTHYITCINGLANFLVNGDSSNSIIINKEYIKIRELLIARSNKIN